MLARVVPVIMSGGSGTRLWPMSTEARPKQFHALAGQATMIQDTVERLKGADRLHVHSPVVVCNARHRDLVYEQLAEVDVVPPAVVLEPTPRNTAPVAAIAAHIAREIDPEALVLLLPADHVVADPAAFWTAVENGAAIARGSLVVFGIRPTGPETGYGYIRRGECLAEGVFRVARFCEKPDLPTAGEYVASGEYDWNAGIFLFSPDTFLEELKAARPDVAAAAEFALRSAVRSGADVRLEFDSFSACPSVSIDYAVMETTDKAAVVPCEIGWADIGSFSELWRHGDKDADGNVLRGPVVTFGARDCLVWSSEAFVGLVGVDNLLVVAAQDGMVVVARDRAQDVKLLVEAYKVGEARRPTVEEMLGALSCEDRETSSA